MLYLLNLYIEFTIFPAFKMKPAKKREALARFSFLCLCIFGRNSI